METKISHIELIRKKQNLEQLKMGLKGRFIGLDDVIDEIISLMMPWYLFPEAQARPTIINMWGLTGSGKTALVHALVEMLDHKKLYSHIDLGEFESDSASWIKNILTNDLAFFHEKPALICLDEFQFARTLDVHNNELGKDKLRVIWDLLDSGRVEYIQSDSTYYLFRADRCLRKLEKAVARNVVVVNGRIESSIEEFASIFTGFFFEYNERNDAKLNADYFLSEDFVTGLFNLFDNDDYSRDEIEKKIKTLSIDGLIDFDKEGMHARPATATLDLSHALIFILGNLDEAYTMSKSMNPDISADEFHEQTSRITIADIKRALRKRFRPEQIARLGNNHVVYKSFNNAHFRMLIRDELKKIADFVVKRFGWKITFDESIIDIVYAEGVFPAQGTRPVLTTVKNLIESKISGLIVSILEYQMDIQGIMWKCEDRQFVFDLVNSNGVTISSIRDDLKLKLGELRKSVDPELQAHTALHEAGHAVLAALTLRIIPSVVVSRTAADMEGFCVVNFPKGPMTRETLKKDIIITLGGWVAEKMIFGEELSSSGVYSDVEEASRLANNAIRKFAMGTDPVHLAVKNTQNDEAFILNRKYTDEAIAIIKSCEAEAEVLLTRNKLLLLKIAEYLTVHSRMEEPLIKEYVIKYGTEAWIKTKGFINKTEYYRFNHILNEHLQSVQPETVRSRTSATPFVKEESLV
jgi:hypothetical protein